MALFHLIYDNITVKIFFHGFEMPTFSIERVDFLTLTAFPKGAAIGFDVAIPFQKK